MILAYILTLGLQVYCTNVRAWKMDGSIFEIFGKILTNFQIENKLGKARFFQKTFLLASIHMEIILSILFLIFSNDNILFTEQKLT